MARPKSTAVEQILNAIALLRKARQSWPEGMANPLVAELIREDEAVLQEKLYQTLSRDEAGTPSEGTRRAKKE
jgi:hypothetical protein